VSDIDPSYAAIVGAWHLPTLVIGILAIVLAAARRLPGRSKGLLIGAGATLVLGRLLSFAWYLSIPTVLSKVGFERYNMVTAVATLVLSAVEVVGLALLLAGALSGRNPRNAGADGPASPWLAERPADISQPWAASPPAAEPFPGPPPPPAGPPPAAGPPPTPGAPWGPPPQ
jgi:hypothetical protein